MTEIVAKTGLAVMTGLVVKTDTTAKTVTTKAEEKINIILLLPWQRSRPFNQ